MALAMLNMSDCAVLLDVDVESVGVEVLSNHHAGADYAALLRQVLLGEAL
jgi:hypothetical protein